jgi:hypothetical protein
MIRCSIYGYLFFLLTGNVSAQYLQGLWNSRAPGSEALVSDMLYPNRHAVGPYLGLAMATLPGLDYASSMHLVYHQPVHPLQADLQLSVSALGIGSHQERSFNLLLGRQFGHSVYVYLQPGYRQMAVRAYGSRGDWVTAAALAYKQGRWLFAFYGQEQLSGERRSPFLQMAWKYSFSERINMGLSLKKLPFYSWQSGVFVDFTPDKRQSFHAALSGRNGFMLAYERQRGGCRIRLGLVYSIPLGMYPENAIHFSW